MASIEIFKLHLWNSLTQQRLVKNYISRYLFAWLTSQTETTPRSQIQFWFLHFLSPSCQWDRHLAISTNQFCFYYTPVNKLVAATSYFGRCRNLEFTINSGRNGIHHLVDVETVFTQDVRLIAHAVAPWDNLGLVTLSLGTTNRPSSWPYCTSKWQVINVVCQEHRGSRRGRPETEKRVYA